MVEPQDSRQSEPAVGERRSDDRASRPLLLLLTGARQAGKTSACRRIAEQATARGWQVAGLLCPAVFRDGQKVGISATALRSGESRPLAVRRPGGIAPFQLGYRFDEATLAWANAVVAAASPCDLLIIDELGPLELELGIGLVSAFEVLRRQQFRQALVVVRPELVGALKKRLALPVQLIRVDDLAADAPIGDVGEGFLHLRMDLHG